MSWSCFKMIHLQLAAGFAMSWKLIKIGDRNMGLLCTSSSICVKIIKSPKSQIIYEYPQTIHLRFKSIFFLWMNIKA